MIGLSRVSAYHAPLIIGKVPGMDAQPTLPAGWDPEADRLWGNGARVAAIQATLARINATPDKPPRLALQAAYYLFMLNDFQGAATLLEHQLKHTPGDYACRANLLVCLTRTRRCAEAIQLARTLLVEAENDFTVLDSMTTCLHRLDRHDEASAMGTRSLEAKDRANSAPPKDWRPPETSPSAFANQTGKRHVIAYSLWGARPEYLRGALRNLLLATDIYPGWILRFNVDPSVPEDFVGLISELGGEVVRHPPDQTLRRRLCWRFEVANDPSVGYFLVRDADSVISAREACAVREWIDSGKWFHVMRDWWSHSDLMLAGMWGGVANVLPNLVPMLNAYDARSAETPNIDQWFLRDRVWNHVRLSCLVHDRCFRPTGAHPFPGRVLDATRHVGQDEYAAHGLDQERVLRPWIKAYPCLGDLRWLTNPV
jgi:hypothetical protein